ncbi:MAG: FkbM family methyltransferase [Candidatus Nanopelagicales bacterium]
MSIRDAEFDPPEVEKHLNTVSGELAFDIGGNNGRVAGMLARRFTQVVSCEPAEESYARLERVPGIVPRNVAVSDHEGTVELAVQADHIKSGQLTSPTGGGEEWVLDRSLGGGGWGEILDSRIVPATTLDALALEFGDPDFVKVDVEGHEGRVIAGGLSVLARAKPALYIEVHNAQLGAEIRGYLDSVYSTLREVWHPYYKATDFGAKNHYWLITDLEG